MKKKKINEKKKKKKKENSLNMFINNKQLNKNLLNKEKKKNDKNLDDDLKHLKIDKELNLTIKQMNSLNKEVDIIYHKYKLANNNLFNSYDKKINLLTNKNKYKIKKVKLFSFSPIAKNGFNVLSLFNGKNKINI